MRQLFLPLIDFRINFQLLSNCSMLRFVIRFQPMTIQ